MNTNAGQDLRGRHAEALQRLRDFQTVTERDARDAYSAAIAALTAAQGDCDCAAWGDPNLDHHHTCPQTASSTPPQGMSIKIPTDTMEQEFASHYRMGYEAGKAAQPAPVTDAVRRAILSADLYGVLMDVQNGIDSPGLPSMANNAIRLIDSARAALSPAAQRVDGWVPILAELADLMDDAVTGHYKPDSFTTQPARLLLAAHGAQP